MWPSYRMVQELANVTTNLNDKLEDKYKRIHRQLQDKSPRLTETQQTLIDTYTSPQFEAKLPSSVIDELKALPRLTVTPEDNLVLYRGERRMDKGRNISCDIGDCITSWSVSPLKAIAVNNNRDSQGTPTLFCATVSAGTQILVLPERENEVLTFARAQVAPHNTLKCEDIDTIVTHRNKRIQGPDGEYRAIFSDEVRRFANDIGSNARVVSGELVLEKSVVLENVIESAEQRHCKRCRTPEPAAKQGERNIIGGDLRRENAKDHVPGFHGPGPYHPIRRLASFS